MKRGRTMGEGMPREGMPRARRTRGGSDPIVTPAATRSFALLRTGVTGVFSVFRYRHCRYIAPQLVKIFCRVPNPSPPRFPQRAAAPPRAVTLDYATLDADGLPMWEPAAEALLDAGRGPKALRRVFRKREDAARYFAKSMRRRHGPAEAEPVCVLCGQEQREYVCEAQWLVVLKPSFFEFTVSSELNPAQATTWHAACPGCYAQWQAGPRIANRWPGLLAVVGSAVIALTFLSLLITLARATRSGHDFEDRVSRLIFFLFLEVIVFFICFKSTRRVRASYHVPAGVREMMGGTSLVPVDLHPPQTRADAGGGSPDQEAYVDYCRNPTAATRQPSNGRH